jgi:transposase
MRQASKRIPDSAEKTVRDIRRATRRHHSAEDKIRIVLEGLRGEDSIAELCRKEGINQNLYYRWSKEFLEAGKKRLAGDTAREATSDEVKELKAEARQLKETLAEVLIENRLLKKAFSGMGRTLHEVFRIRKVRDHRTGGTVVALDSSNTGADRDPEIDVLRLVQPLPGGRDRGSGGRQAQTATDLEQDPRRDQHGDRQFGP